MKRPSPGARSAGLRVRALQMSHSDHHDWALSSFCLPRYGGARHLFRPDPVAHKSSMRRPFRFYGHKRLLSARTNPYEIAFYFTLTACRPGFNGS